MVGALSGGAAAVITSPLDVVKTRQAQGIVQGWREEGGKGSGREGGKRDETSECGKEVIEKRKRQGRLRGRRGGEWKERGEGGREDEARERAREVREHVRRGR